MGANNRIEGVSLTACYKRSELTALLEAATDCGYMCYRTRLSCECETANNIRDGVVVANSEREITMYAIRCNKCAKMIDERFGIKTGGSL